MAEKTVPEMKKDNAPTREATRSQDRFVQPRVDIFKSKDGLEVLAEMPGIEQGNLDVRVKEGILTIEARCTRCEEPRNWLYQEFEPVSYFREFEVNDDIDQEKIEADFRHGVLRLKLPFAARTRPRQIAVKISE